MNRMRFAVVGLALLATACTTGKVSGEARPGNTDTPTTTASSESSSSLADIKPCELVNSAEAGQLGLTAPPEARKLAGEDTCEWIDRNGGLLILLSSRRGADAHNYPNNTKSPARFGKFDGYTISAPGGAKDQCHVVISVTDSSSVQISGGIKANLTDTAKACELATKAAELVAAKLP